MIFADSGTAGGSVDVPLGKKGSWLFSARRSYIDVALDVAGIAEQGIIGYPRTFDFTNKFIYDLTTRHKLSVSVLNFLKTLSRLMNRHLISVAEPTDFETVEKKWRQNSLCSFVV